MKKVRKQFRKARQFWNRPRIKPIPERPLTPPPPVPIRPYQTNVRYGTDHQIIDENERKAVFGRIQKPDGREGKPIHGPADFQLYWHGWRDVGTHYKAKPPPSSTDPFIQQFMDKLKEPKNGIEIGRKIGAGGFGVVYRARVNGFLKDKDGNPRDLQLACKVLSLSTYDTQSVVNYVSVREAMNRLLAESNIHTSAKHPNIVQAEDTFYLYDESSGFPMPIHVLHFMELCDGDLKTMISNNNRFSEQDACEWFAQAVSGLRYLHETNIVHLDLKPHNILYIQNPHNPIQYLFKITDFGLAKMFPEKMPAITQFPGGTRYYMAPEVLASKGNVTSFDGKAADIYSLGFTLAKSLCGTSPGTGTAHPTPMDQLLDAAKRWNDRVKQLWGINFFVSELMTRMTEKDPQFRPTIEEVQEHTFLTRRNYISGEWSEPMPNIIV